MSIGRGTAHPVQGLICPHGYMIPALRLYPYEGFYCAMRGLTVTTDVAVGPAAEGRELFINGQPADAASLARVSRFVESTGLASEDIHFRIDSWCNFPIGAGLGSSSAAFAALTYALDEALGANLAPDELARLARLGSSSAAGSVVGGISVLRTGDTHEQGTPEVLVEAGQVPFEILQLADTPAERLAEDAHMEAALSPVFEAATVEIQRLGTMLEAALRKRAWESVGRLVEKYVYLGGAVTMTGPLNAVLWSPDTIRLLVLLRGVRQESGLNFFFSMNTGSNVYVYVLDECAEVVKGALRAVGLTWVATRAGGGARRGGQLSGGSGGGG